MKCHYAALSFSYRMNPNAQHVLFPHYVRILETIQGAILSLMRVSFASAHSDEQKSTLIT